MNLTMNKLIAILLVGLLSFNASAQDVYNFYFQKSDKKKKVEKEEFEEETHAASREPTSSSTSGPMMRPSRTRRTPSSRFLQQLSERSEWSVCSSRPSRLARSGCSNVPIPRRRCSLHRSLERWAGTSSADAWRQ